MRILSLTSGKSLTKLFPHSNSQFYVYFLSLLIYFERERERERERESVHEKHEEQREVGRKRDRGRIPNRLHAVSTEPDVGLKPLNREIMT